MYSPKIRLITLASATALAVLAALGLAAGPATAATFDCSNAFLFYCQETDTPGTGNSAAGGGLPNQQDTGHGAFCLTPYYSSSGTITLTGHAWTSFTGGTVPQEARWRVFFSTDPSMEVSTKPFKTEAESVGPVFVSSNPGGPTTAGYFKACINNYESGAPMVDFTIAVRQAD